MKKCRCLFYHPQTKEERKAVADNLDYSRKIGDSIGIMLSMAQLQGCPPREAA